MKLRLAFNLLPYIQLTRSSGTLGSSKLLFVWLREDADITTQKHEEVHVLFWYIVTAIVATLAWLLGLPLFYALSLAILVDPLLNTFVPAYTRFEEPFAYARGATYKSDPEHYLAQLEHSKLHTDKYGARFVDNVRKRMKWWK